MNIDLLMVEREYVCSCGCGQTTKGIGVGPLEWFHFSIWEPRYYEVPQTRCHDLVFASRYCIRRYFKDWQPAPLKGQKAWRGR